MLIYNFQKEFIGIDESDLKTLGFSNLSQLRAESADFADLFVRTPGYIHNFKHVHWIDFISCADQSEDSRVIIDVNSRTFTAKITISSVFLTDNPTSKAYLVHLNNLRTLTNEEVSHISDELSQRPTPVAAPFTPEPEIQEEPFVQKIVEPVNIPEPEQSYTPVEESITQDIPETSIPDMIEIDDFDLMQEDEQETKEEHLSIPEPTIEEESIEKEELDENFDYDYQYDPQVASDELGLPIDLIEEFIQDFISQAQEFKADLYSSLDEADIDNVKILSHKLKGVAANLRIEDAFNTLSIINTSDDHAEIRTQLNTFYKIIAKLSGEEVQTTKTEPETPKEEKIEETSDDLYDDLVIDFKEDEKEEEEEDLYQDIELEEIKDTDVPDSIDIPELADDEFLAQEDLLDLQIEEDDNTENLELETEVPQVEYSKTLVANEIGLDKETFEELFHDYIQESKNILDTIDTAIESDDIVKVKQETIKLKGMSENMRVHSFSDQLDILMNNSDKQEMSAAVQTINTIINQISK